jgi:hypothetical protein
MAPLRIPFFPGRIPSDIQPGISPLEIFQLRENSWPAYPDNAEITISTAWNRDFLSFHFRVKEKEVRALAEKSNGPVWEDSCVELFLCPEGSRNYYNFEFNCIGTCLLGYGSGSDKREHAPDAVIDRIIRKSSLGINGFYNRPCAEPWELSLAIPPSAFFKENLTEFRPSTIRGNFYKCGDRLSQPHFLSWRRIDSATPDFHRPDYFDDIILQPLP